MESISPERMERIKMEFIAGYTSGGAPYGIAWEEMGMRAWQSLEDEEVEAMDVK